MQAASNVIRSDQVISAGMKCTLCDEVACLSQESHWGFLLAHFKPSSEKDMTHLGLA